MGTDRPTSLLAARGSSPAVACGFLLILMFSCGRNVITDTFAPGGSSAIDATAQDIRAEAESTIKVANDGLGLAPELPMWPMIVGQQVRIIDYTTDLIADAKALKSSEAECAKLREKAGQWERFACSLFIVFGGIGLVAAPVVAYFAAPRLAMLIALAGASSIGVGVFLRDWSWTLGLAVGGGVLFLGCVTGYMVYRRYVEDNRDAEGMARLAREALDPAKPDQFREFIAALRKDWPQFNRAMESKP